MSTQARLLPALACVLLVGCSKSTPDSTKTTEPASQPAPAAAPATPPPSEAPPPAASQPAAPASSQAPASQPSGQPAARPSNAAPSEAHAPAAKAPVPSSPAPSVNSEALSPAPAAPAAAAAEPPPPPVPRIREVTIPSTAVLTVNLSTPLASDTSTVEDHVTGKVTRSVLVNGVKVVPAGSEVTGTVTNVERSGRVKGRATITFRFDHLAANGERYAISTDAVTREAAASTKSDVKKGGIGAAAGAIIGGIAGGGKGAAIGGAVGGTGAVMATRGDEVRLPAGTIVSVHLSEPLTVQIEEPQ